MSQSAIKVFISYRVSDTGLLIGHIHQRFKAAFGKENVFLDFAALEISADFREAIAHAIDQCNVIVVVIGKHWLGEKESADKKPMLFGASDWVCLEVARALETKKQIVPVLVDDTSMPKIESLPASLKDLTYKHGARLSSRDNFDVDIDRILKVIRKAWGEAPETKRAEALDELRYRHKGRVVKIAGPSFAVIILLATTIAGAHHFGWYDPGPAVVWVLLLSPAVVGSVVLTMRHWDSKRTLRELDRKYPLK